MKVRITHLKAPWPAGAAIGSVVEVPGEAIPAWAAGKCQDAGDGAEAEFTWEAPASVEQAAPVPTLPPGAQEAIDVAVKAATEPLQAQLAEQAKTIEALQAKASAETGALTVNPGAEGAAKPAAKSAKPAA